MTYSIGEMAARLGVSTSTPRFYDKEELLPSVQRTGKGIRVFSDQDYAAGAVSGTVPGYAEEKD